MTSIISHALVHLEALTLPAVFPRKVISAYPTASAIFHPGRLVETTSTEEHARTSRGPVQPARSLASRTSQTLTNRYSIAMRQGSSVVKRHRIQGAVVQIANGNSNLMSQTILSSTLTGPVETAGHPNRLRQAARLHQLRQQSCSLQDPPHHPAQALW